MSQTKDRDWMGRKREWGGVIDFVVPETSQKTIEKNQSRTFSTKTSHFKPFFCFSFEVIVASVSRETDGGREGEGAAEKGDRLAGKRIASERRVEREKREESNLREFFVDLTGISRRLD